MLADWHRHERRGTCTAATNAANNFSDSSRGSGTYLLGAIRIESHAVNKAIDALWCCVGRRGRDAAGEQRKHHFHGLEACKKAELKSRYWGTVHMQLGARARSERQHVIDEHQRHVDGHQPVCITQRSDNGWEKGYI